jgi:hypothetical protein
MADQAMSTETAGPLMKESYAGRAMGRVVKRRKKKLAKKAEAADGGR